MTAMINHYDLHARRRSQFFQRLRTHEGVIASCDNQRRHLNPSEDWQARSLTIVVEGVFKTPMRRGVEIIKHAHRYLWREDRKRIWKIAGALVRQPHKCPDKIGFIPLISSS